MTIRYYCQENYFALIVLADFPSIDWTVEILEERREKRELTSSLDAAAFLMCLVKTPRDVPNFSVSAPISRKAAKIWPACFSILDPSKLMIIARRYA